MVRQREKIKHDQKVVNETRSRNSCRSWTIRKVGDSGLVIG